MHEYSGSYLLSSGLNWSGKILSPTPLSLSSASLSSPLSPAKVRRLLGLFGAFPRSPVTGRIHQYISDYFHTMLVHKLFLLTLYVTFQSITITGFYLLQCIYCIVYTLGTKSVLHQNDFHSSVFFLLVVSCRNSPKSTKSTQVLAEVCLHVIISRYAY